MEPFEQIIKENSFIGCFLQRLNCFQRLREYLVHIYCGNIIVLKCYDNCILFGRDIDTCNLSLALCTCRPFADKIHCFFIFIVLFFVLFFDPQGEFTSVRSEDKTSREWADSCNSNISCWFVECVKELSFYLVFVSDGHYEINFPSVCS